MIFNSIGLLLDDIGTQTMIQARELQIDDKTTVTDLFKLIDIPRAITKKVRVRLAPEGYNRRMEFVTPFVLRLEWDVEKGDPAV